jgi:hypothetical protein
MTTLRGMISSGWNTFLRINPITGPAFLAKDLAESKQFQDAVKVTAETTKKAVKAANDTANAVLDYPIEKGAAQVAKAAADGYGAAAKAVDDNVVKPTVDFGKAAYNGTVDAGKAAVNGVATAGAVVVGGAVYGVQTAGELAVDGYNGVVDGAVETYNDAAEAVDNAGKAVDNAQKDARRGIASWIAPD